MLKKYIYFILIMVFSAGNLYAEVLDVPLYKIARVKAVDLKCITDEYSVTLSIPERWHVESASIMFPYMNSTALLKDKSSILVKLNGYPLKQINLDPHVPEGTARVTLPVRLIESGYNTITFSASQHYTLKCEKPCAADLWTTLKLDRARAKIEYSLKPVPLKLSALSNFLFDPKILPAGKVNFVIEDTSLVQMGGIVASGIARRFDYRKALFTVSAGLKPGVDNVLVGKKAFVETFLQNRGIRFKGREGSLLKIMHLPEKEKKEALLGEEESMTDSAHALIVVSGVDESQIKLAAMTMAIMSIPYPDTDEMIALEFSLPDIAQYGGRSVLTPDKVYDFKTLNFGTQTFKGINPAPAEISFRLPADFFVRQNMYADISLSYTYGSRMRGDSVLNVSINDRNIRAIPLDNERGDLIEGYRMTIPTYLFKPGTNTIKLTPILTPSVANDCELIQTENLFLTVLEESYIKFPPMPHLVKLPRLDLFLLNGFPFTRWPDGYESLIYVADRDTRSIASAYNIMGMLTQKNGYPLFAMDIVFDEPAGWDGEIFTVGRSDAIPDNIARAVPFNVNGETSVPYPVVRSWEGEEQIAFSRQKSSLGTDKGVFMQFQSPYREGRTMMVATATTSQGVYGLTEALLDYGVQAKIKGDVALIELDPPDYLVYPLKVGEDYFTGKSGQISKIDFYLHSYPYLYHLSLGITILVLALVTFYFLRRYWKKRMKYESKETH
ncbi:MAG: cellulose biosynthesis cyclic di-GMP-binding regulatory protein BcsB [Deltaproteobacteria bacterium]|nr:cellulose biosynthesis cyclic di-GMP-binding regulatory protein BcsB [Deltaproteobacteria bacterium]